MNLPKPGDRIRLVKMNDDPDPIEAGAEGTVEQANDMQIWVKWDNGRALALITDLDVWQVIE